MACIKGKSICETCGKEFEWRKHDSQPPARFCNRKCTNKDFGIKGNAKRAFWPYATNEEKNQRLINFYEQKVVKKIGCWDWNGSCDKNGYAQLYNGSTKAKGHRVSYQIHKGIIPEGMEVCHTCDNPKCTNPDHLWLETKKENNDDKVKKGRSCKGEDKPNSKLKDEDVREIRKMLGFGIPKAHISRKYNVTFMTISYISKGKTWRHVK